MKVYDLSTRYDDRASFYNKARIEETDETITLLSYNTVVCRIYKKEQKAVIYGFYSNTTTRHIREFLKQNDFKATTKEQMSKDYLAEKEA